MSARVIQTCPMEVNLVLPDTIITITVTAIIVAMIAMITMFVAIDTIIVTMTIIKTVVMRTTVMKRSIASNQIVVVIITTILMANKQMTSRQFMLITASCSLEAVIAPLNEPLILPATDQTVDIVCCVVALTVPWVVALLLTIKWIVRMLACAPTVLQAMPRMTPMHLATSLGVSCLVANRWLMFPSWTV